MKRFLIFFFMVLIALTASARPPKLNVEKLFDGRYNNNKSVSISVYKNNGNYYRGITVKNNLKIIKAIADAIERISRALKTIPTIREMTEDTRHCRLSITVRPYISD